MNLDKIWGAFNILYCFGISLDKFQQIIARDIVTIANF